MWIPAIAVNTQDTEKDPEPPELKVSLQEELVKAQQESGFSRRLEASPLNTFTQQVNKTFLYRLTLFH